MHYTEEGGSGFGWFLAGLGLGAGVAMLLAPKTGREVRGFIAEKAGDAREFVSRRGADVYEKGREWAEQASSMVSGAKAPGTETGTEGMRTGTTTERPGPRFAQG